MAGFLLRRLGQAILVMWVISLLGFSLQESVGDPLQSLVGQSVSQQERQLLREEMGLELGFWQRYGQFLGAVLQGDLGTSYFFKEPALEVILKKFPATLELVFSAMLWVLLISIPVGVYAAIRPEGRFARLTMALTVTGISVPVFLTAIVLIYFFSVELGWLPSFGRGETVALPGGWQSGWLTADGLEHLLLPSITLASVMLPLFTRLVRAQMLEVLQSDYIKYAWARGLSPARIYFLHALKNALIPLITVAGVQLGTMVACAILTETIFQWPGLGFLFLEAVNRADTPLIVAYLIVIGGLFVLINTVVDVVYGLVNPGVDVVGGRS